MNEIIGSAEYILTEKKSKFITRIYKVCDTDKISEILSYIQKSEKGAAHNCYAYRILQDGIIIEMKSDDGEPGGTAGAPMLSVLAGNDLVNVLAVTTRYFGGIKLGTGGLSAAYKKGAVQVIRECAILPVRQTERWTLIFPFSECKYAEYIMEKNGIRIAEKIFASDVTFRLELTAEEQILISKLIENRDIILEKEQQ